MRVFGTLGMTQDSIDETVHKYLLLVAWIDLDSSSSAKVPPPDKDTSLRSSSRSRRYTIG